MHKLYVVMETHIMNNTMSTGPVTITTTIMLMVSMPQYGLIFLMDTHTHTHAHTHTHKHTHTYTHTHTRADTDITMVRQRAELTRAHTIVPIIKS